MRLTELFQRGEFVVTAEVGPPKGYYIDHLLHEADTYLKGRVHAVNVTDNQKPSCAGFPCHMRTEEQGLQPHLPDLPRRNRIALQSDVMSAALFGIDNILASPATIRHYDNPRPPVFDRIPCLCCIWWVSSKPPERSRQRLKASRPNSPGRRRLPAYSADVNWRRWRRRSGPRQYFRPGPSSSPRSC